MILGLSIGTEYYLALSALLSQLELAVFWYADPLVMFMCIELMLNAANFAFISFGKNTPRGTVIRTLCSCSGGSRGGNRSSNSCSSDAKKT